MTGEALAIQTSLTVSFLQDFVRSVLERGNSEAAQDLEKFGTAYSGNLCEDQKRFLTPVMSF
jgi:hypothetical protein